jgi:hypothetical protein
MSNIVKNEFILEDFKLPKNYNSNYTNFNCDFFWFTDIITTFLASPDLQLEVNPIVVYFGRAKTALILTLLANFIFYTFTYVYSFNYFLNKEIKSKELFKFYNYKDLKLVLSSIFYVLFYYYLFILIFISINNFISHLWLHTSWKQNVNWYINLSTSSQYFFNIFHVIGIVIGSIIFIWQIKKADNANSNLQ